ncbi:MAG: hypothetical protein GY856_15760 [bacterium]|nr:hypothetical protein [bacterium]
MLSADPLKRSLVAKVMLAGFTTPELPDVAPPECCLEPLASDRALIRLEADEAVRLEVWRPWRSGRPSLCVARRWWWW